MEGEEQMKCYICAKQGIDEEAVAICIVCGMGLCLGHAFKEELVVADVINWGFGREGRIPPHVASIHLRRMQTGHWSEEESRKEVTSRIIWLLEKGCIFGDCG